MNIGKFSVSNPVLVNVLWAALLVLGLFSFVRLPRETFSNIDFSWVFIVVPYPGVSAEEVEKNVTIRIEQGLDGIDKLKNISSISREGISFVQVEFEDGISRPEFLRLFQDLRTAFDKVQLPDGTLDAAIDEFSSADFSPLITVVLKGDADDATVNRVVRDLRDRFLAIGDISRVEVVGTREREIRVDVDKKKLEAFGISLQQVADALKFRNTNVAAGTVTSDTREYLLRTLGELDRSDNFGRVIIRRRPGGEGSIRVGDVASVSNGFAEAQYDSRFDRQPSVSLFIAKKPEGNSLRAVKAIRGIVDEYRAELPPGLDITFFNDTSIFIRESLATLGSNALMGFILLVLVLFFFLGSRNALLTAMGIPVTFALTFMFMEWYGESLNGNSLFALVLVLGLIVDHAIVIMENSYRHRQMGKSREEAAITGVNEVIKPVIAATATTIAAFLPLMLLPGLLGKFLRVIPLVVSFALVASTVESLVFLPSHFAEWGGKVKTQGEGFFAGFQDWFSRLVARLYRRRYITLLVTLVVIVVSLMLTPYLRQDLYAGESLTFFYIDIRMPVGTPRAVTDRVVSRFEERLIPLVGKEDIVSISSTIGFLTGDTDRLTSNNVAQITVDVRERNEGRKRPIREIMDEISRLTGDIPGAEQVTYRMIRNGPPVDKPVSFRLQGRRLEDMAALADVFKRDLAGNEELYNISDNYERGSPELRVIVNEERAAELGLSVGQIGFYLRNAFDGVKATTFFDNDEEVDVIVKFSSRYRASVHDVMAVRFPTPDGRQIPFSAVCRIDRGTGVASIRRVDGEREITVTADATDKTRIRSIMAKIQSDWEMRYKALYSGVTLKLGGEFAEFNKLFVELLRLLWIGVFLIYLILGTQFKSYTQPFLMIFTLFFGIVGCVLYLFVSRTPVSLVVLYATVALIGIAVNDAIVLISFVNSLRRKGMAITEAIIEGAKTRLRPILLTSVTTIGGLLPMAIGLGNQASELSAMASIIMFGLVFSTLGTLLVIPCAYGILDDLIVKSGRSMKLEGE